MAKLLSSHDSATRCLNIVRRHERLIKQVVNDSQLISSIKTSRENLEQKVKLKTEKQTVRENTYDDMILSDHNLDDSIRSTYEKCEQYDRGNPSERILKKIFPDEKYGEIVRLPFLKEIASVEKIVIRIESLGASHSIYSLADEIKSRLTNTSEAIKANEASIREIKLAEAEVEIAKESLIRQYESNYLDARKTYGKNTCEKLFPRVNNQTETVEEEEKPVETTTQV